MNQCQNLRSPKMMGEAYQKRCRRDALDTLLRVTNGGWYATRQGQNKNQTFRDCNSQEAAEALTGPGTNCVRGHPDTLRNSGAKKQKISARGRQPKKKGWRYDKIMRTTNNGTNEGAKNARQTRNCSDSVKELTGTIANVNLHWISCTVLLGCQCCVPITRTWSPSAMRGKHFDLPQQRTHHPSPVKHGSANVYKSDTCIR